MGDEGSQWLWDVQHVDASWHGPLGGNINMILLNPSRFCFCCCCFCGFMHATSPNPTRGDPLSICQRSFFIIHSLLCSITKHAEAQMKKIHRFTISIQLGGPHSRSSRKTQTTRKANHENLSINFILLTHWQVIKSTFAISSSMRFALRQRTVTVRRTSPIDILSLSRLYRNWSSQVSWAYLLYLTDWRE